MGAILYLKKMPETCRECPFSERKDKLCTIRGTRVIAYDLRENRMPLCPLMNEGDYLTWRDKDIRKAVKHGKS